MRITDDKSPTTETSPPLRLTEFKTTTMQQWQPTKKGGSRTKKADFATLQPGCNLIAPTLP